MKRERVLPLAGAVWLAMGLSCWAQRAGNWRVYRAADGLPDPGCISVTFSPQGKVVVKHFSEPAFSELDGYSIRTFGFPEHGNGRIYTSSGDQFWTVLPDGVSEFRDDQWILHRVPDVAAEFKAGRLRVVEPIPMGRLYPVRRGMVLLLLSEKLLALNFENPEHNVQQLLRAANQTKLQRFSSLAPTRDGGLWIAGERGVARLPGPVRNIKPDTAWTEYILPDQLQVQNVQEPHEDADGTITAVAETVPDKQRVVVHLSVGSQDWTVERAGGQKIRQAWRSLDGTSWSCTSRGLFEKPPGATQIAESDEVSAQQYFDMAQEPKGAFWLATSDGLFRYAPLIWQTPEPVLPIKAAVHALAPDGEGGVWFVSGAELRYLKSEGAPAGSAIFRSNPGAAPHSAESRTLSAASKSRESALTPSACPAFIIPAGSALRNGEINALYPLKNGAVLIVCGPPPEKEEAAQKFFEFQPATGSFMELSPGLFSIHDSNVADANTGAESPSDDIKTGPSGRVKAIGRLKDGSICFARVVSGSTYLLSKWDSDKAEAMPAPAQGSLGDNLYSLFAAQNGDVWLSGELGAAWLHDKTWRVFSSSDKTLPESAQCFAELPDGKIWCASPDQIWEFDGRNWSSLRRGLNRINGMVRTLEGSVWVASNSGLLRWFQGAWVENGVEDGLPSAAVREIIEDQRGRLLAATSRGLTLYHPEADPDPPQTIIQSLGDTVPEGKIIAFSFSGQDKWKYTPRERLLYSYRLDERDWTAFREGTGISFSDLAAGKHYFQVRAMDRNCKIQPKATQFDFVVVLPWYKEARLVLISSAGAAVAIFFAGLAFNRHRRLVRSYAEIEKKVAQRTSELEMANRELLHSQKMTALGTLAAGIAHDFNNILSIIQGSVQIIEDNLAHPQKVRTRLDRIKTVVEQGSGIVKAMLGFSRDSSAEEPSFCDVNNVVKDTIRLLGDRFLREVEVSFKPSTDLPPAVGSKDFIQQILLNFIFNAAEATSPERGQLVRADDTDAGGGKTGADQAPARERRGQAVRAPIIIVAARRTPEPLSEMVLTPAAAPGYVTISVQDFGCGIAPENRARLFEPFFTTKALSTRRGTGLGLSMAYELARKMGAGLAFESQVGQGSTFFLVLAASE